MTYKIGIINYFKKGFKGIFWEIKTQIPFNMLHDSATYSCAYNPARIVRAKENFTAVAAEIAEFLLLKRIEITSEPLNFSIGIVVRLAELF